VEAALDYGQAIKIPPPPTSLPATCCSRILGDSSRAGDLYDYDELCLLTECASARCPRGPSRDGSAEPWFSVGERDVPEEFALPDPAGRAWEAFMRVHADLLSVEFWRRMQELRGLGRSSILPLPALPALSFLPRMNPRSLAPGRIPMCGRLFASSRSADQRALRGPGRACRLTGELRRFAQKFG
jgi:hypothetical protein